MIFLPFSGKKNNYVIGNWNYFCHFNIRHPVFYTVEEGSWINSYLDALNCGLMVANGAIEVWQYGLWSFQTGDTKLERFLPKNDYTQRKWLNSECWINGKLSKIIQIFLNFFSNFISPVWKLHNPYCHSRHRFLGTKAALLPAYKVALFILG